MRRSFLQPSTSLPDQSYVDLVQSLFRSLLPSVIMTALFVGVMSLAVAVTADVTLLLLALMGTLLSLLRLAIVIACRRRGIETHIGDRPSAARYEKWFGRAYFGFASTLGLAGGRVMTIPIDDLQMVFAASVVGYAAGVTASISSRPRIAGASMAAAVLPTALFSLASLQVFHVALGVVLLSLLAGALHNLQARYRVEVEQMEFRGALGGLARRDPLTGLHNRLGLRERLDAIIATRQPDCLIALHCLDLDRFKPVNDRYGHPVGDELLRMVAERLTASLRQGDVAVRMGGDEFVVLQQGLHHSDEADLLARRLIRSLTEPFSVSGHSIGVGVSIGYVVSYCDEALEGLLIQADNALYGIKALGGGTAAHSDMTIDKSRIVMSGR